MNVNMILAVETNYGFSKRKFISFPIAIWCGVSEM